MRIILTILGLTCLLFPFPASASATQEADGSAARILVYFTVGRDEAPDSNVTLEQFKAHVLELAEGGYKVLPLPDIVEAYAADKPLPENTVAITFDGGDRSVLEKAAPLLEEYHLPYTVFIATSRADMNDPRYLNWDDIRLMLKSPLVSVGLHPDIYGNISNESDISIRQSLNNATARLRDETQINARVFAYPFGMTGKRYKDIVSAYGFTAAVGQQSGVASNTMDRFLLPRFTMTEDYADAQRFKMTVEALPLPVSDVTPNISHIKNSQPAIGFTVSDDTLPLGNMTCFASDQDKPDINIVGKARVEIRLKEPIKDERFRLNCTLPVSDDTDEDHGRWRWFGLLMSADNESDS